VSLSEMLFLGLLGLVIFGPKRLASVGQQAGKTLARWKKISSEFQSQLATEISTAVRERPTEQEESTFATPTSAPFDLPPDSVLICNYTGKEVVE
jgi:Sec-independent protein translocase protein TatA